MKALGIIIIIAGLLMFIFPRFTYVKEEQVADLKPLAIDNKDDRPFDLPVYAAGIAIIAGVIVVLAEKKKA